MPSKCLRSALFASRQAHLASEIQPAVPVADPFPSGVSVRITVPDYGTSYQGRKATVLERQGTGVYNVSLPRRKAPLEVRAEHIVLCDAA